MDDALKYATLPGGKLRVIYGHTYFEVWVDERNTSGIGALPSGAIPADKMWLPKRVIRIDSLETK